MGKQHTAVNQEAADCFKHDGVQEEQGLDSGIELAPETAKMRKPHDMPLELASSTDEDKANRRLKPDLAAFERIIRHEIRQPKPKQKSLSTPYRPAEQPSSTPEPASTNAATTTRGMDNMFLLSLTAPNDASISDSDVELLATRPERKNRPGQQARRLRNERKYGSNARHLQKDGRDAGWDKKRGAVEQAPRLKKKRAHDNLRSTAATQARGNKRQNRDDEGTLHPSWKAKKKLKTAENSVSAWSGKKTTFGD